MRIAQRTEYEVLGRVIKECREEIGLTQRALARQAGRTETSIHKIEVGNQRVDLIELLDIANALRVDLLELVGRFKKNLAD